MVYTQSSDTQFTQGSSILTVTLAGSFDGAGTDSSGNTAYLQGGFVAEK